MLPLKKNLGRASGGISIFIVWKSKVPIRGKVKYRSEDYVFLPKINLGRASGGPFRFCVREESNADLRLKYCCPKGIWAEPPVELSVFYSLEKSKINIGFSISAQNNFGQTLRRTFRFL